MSTEVPKRDNSEQTYKVTVLYIIQITALICTSRSFNQEK